MYNMLRHIKKNKKVCNPCTADLFPQRSVWNIIIVTTEMHFDCIKNGIID